MRKVTQQTVHAFLDKQKLTKGNTHTDTFNLYLHGNCIARHVEGGGFEITSAGWETHTTKERLNGLPGVHITQKAFQWYLNGEKWDGNWKFIPFS